MHFIDYLSPFMQYLARDESAHTNNIPSLKILSQDLGLSISTIREQMEVARVLGLVEVRPRVGIRRQEYSFLPAIRQSLGYAIVLDRSYFDSFSNLRTHIETAYWFEAVQKLTPEDYNELQALVDRAWEKLRGTPIMIPHNEHRELHLTIYRRLDNPFVDALLEAYWEAYETVGLRYYNDYRYLETVWKSHQQIVNLIISGDFTAGHALLLEHTDLIQLRPD